MTKFSVRTHDAAALRRASEELASIACRDFAPNVLLGVRSGGYFVAELMAPAIPNATLLPITCRRASTQKKESSGLLKTVLKRLPGWVNDRLRVAEHIWLTQLSAPKPNTGFTPDEAELAAISRHLDKLGGTARILIVDDSVDSGATFAAVIETVREVADGEAQIKTAAITVTTENPLVQPDFSLYHYVLCRFPWSFDFKS